MLAWDLNGVVEPIDGSKGKEAITRLDDWIRKAEE
jgi:hypothetical protein